MNPILTILTFFLLCLPAAGGIEECDLSNPRIQRVVAASLEDPDIVNWSKHRDRIQHLQLDSDALLAEKLRRAGIDATREQARVIMMQAVHNGRDLPAGGAVRAQKLTRELPNWNAKNRHGHMSELRRAVEEGPDWIQPGKRNGLSVDGWKGGVRGPDGAPLRRGRAQQMKVIFDPTRAYAEGFGDYIQYLGNFKGSKGGRVGYDCLVPADTFDSLVSSGEINASGYPIQISKAEMLRRRDSLRERSGTGSEKFKRATDYTFFDQDIRPGQFKFVRMRESHAELVSLSDRENAIKRSLYRRNAGPKSASSSVIAFAFIIVDSASIFGQDRIGLARVRGSDFAQYTLSVFESADSASKMFDRSRAPIAHKSIKASAQSASTLLKRSRSPVVRRFVRAPGLARASRLASRANIALQLALAASTFHRYMTGSIGSREFSTLIAGHAGAFAGAKFGFSVGALVGPLGAALGAVLGGAVGYFAGEMVAASVWGHLDEADREYYLAVLAGSLHAR